MLSCSHHPQSVNKEGSLGVPAGPPLRQGLPLLCAREPTSLEVVSLVSSLAPGMSQRSVTSALHTGRPTGFWAALGLPTCWRGPEN